MQTITYENDFAAWAFQQAGLMRAGKLNHLDLLNLIEEMESMGRSEHRQLESRFTVLVGHLLKRRYQAERRGNSWRRTINAQRKSIMKLLKDSPSLKAHFDDAGWLDDVWDGAVTLAMSETELDVFPETPVWRIAEILNPDFFPE